MERKVGTISRGIRCPIIREGDDLVEITVNSVLEAAASEGYEIRNRDVVALTESIVARSQGNYASVDAIAEDVPDGFVSSCNGEIVELNVDGQPLNASKVTFDDNGAVLTIITNTFTSVELPKTGGPGTILYTTGGLLLIAAAIFLLFYNRKSQISRP